MNQDLLTPLIAEIDHAGLPFRRKRAWLREPVDDPERGEEGAPSGRSKNRGTINRMGRVGHVEDVLCTSHEVEILYRDIDDDVLELRDLPQDKILDSRRMP